MKKKIKCKVCNTRFAPTSEKLYLVKERVGGLALLAAGSNPRILECFDCPSCGCQNMVNIRATEAPPEPEEPDTEDTDAVGVVFEEEAADE